jgi:hypothetical protein
VITKLTLPSYLNNDFSFVKRTVTYAGVCFSDKTNRLSAHSKSTSTTLLLVVTPHLRQSEKPGVSTHLQAEGTSGATPAAWATGMICESSLACASDKTIMMMTDDTACL